MSNSYQDFYRHSIEDPDSFWGEQAKLIDWHKPFSRVLYYSKPPFSKWFDGVQPIFSILNGKNWGSYPLELWV